MLFVRSCCWVFCGFFHRPDWILCHSINILSVNLLLCSFMFILGSNRHIALPITKYRLVQVFTEIFCFGSGTKFLWHFCDFWSSIFQHNAKTFFICNFYHHRHTDVKEIPRLLSYVFICLLGILIFFGTQFLWYFTNSYFFKLSNLLKKSFQRIIFVFWKHIHICWSED